MSTPNGRPPVWAWLAYAASAVALLVLWVLPGHKYAWMEAVDPTIDPAALVDGSGNRWVFATVVTLLAVGLQALWLLKAGRARGTGHLVAPCLLIVAVLALWALKFGR